MKRILFFSLTLFLLFITPSFTENENQGNKINIFPELDGWHKKGEPVPYRPDNLFEYINGAAEVYLSYDFQKLITQTYENEKNQSITVDIYQHSNQNTGFGIYSQEKPEQGNFLKIGTQGYYETGVLNFFKSQYYVKLIGFDLKEDDQLLLENIARRLDKKLEGKPLFPKAISCFPEDGKIKNSERFIFKNYLGHSFLHSAFVADYKIKNHKFQIFIIETRTQPEAETMIKNYLNFLEKRKIKYQIYDQDTYQFQDPYYRSSGNMGLKMNKNYLWGFFYKDKSLFRSLIDKIEQNLKSQQLI
ncbi:MAG: hypothetical protein KAT17_02580 [Candidatus Aminicenantes bacterium]|nr:hypothetical protein [Candidatus Aminicenantes bacterium]